MKFKVKMVLSVAAMAAMFSFQSCKDDEGDGTPGPTQNIEEYLTSDGGYGVMLDALEKFGLKTQLGGTGNFTLLALSDNQLIADAIDLVNMADADAEDFVKYHFFTKKLSPGNFPTNGYIATESAGGPGGEKLAIYTEVVGEAVRFNGKNYIKKVDATNGVLYVMEGSLVPPTVIEALAINPNISTYKTAINLAAAIKDSLAMGPNTVFATSETEFVVFLNANNTTITGLNPSIRRAILNNSIIPGANKQTSGLSATETTLGEDLLVTESGGTITLNGKSTVNKSNGQCTDGVIHVISHLLN
jgi:transforming growth factor-beta-induced protein